ncbi:MAG: hypothetical protein AVDCRST_MAG56-557, partial [uncultured Cytophagales bacterium]
AIGKYKLPDAHFLQHLLYGGCPGRVPAGRKPVAPKI